MAENAPDTATPLARTDSPTHTPAKVSIGPIGLLGPLGPKNLVVAVTSTVVEAVDLGFATAKDPGAPATPQAVAFAVPSTAVTMPAAWSVGRRGKTKTAVAENAPDTATPLARTDSPTHTPAKVSIGPLGPLGPKNLVVAVTSTVVEAVDLGFATAKDPGAPATPQAVGFAVPSTAVTMPAAWIVGRRG